MAFLLLLVPLISPQGWDYVLILGTPVIVCLLDRWRDRSLGWRIATALGFALTSFTVFDIVGRTMYIYLMAISAVTLGALLVAASAAQLRWRALA